MTHDHVTPEATAPEQHTTGDAALNDKLTDAMVPGFEVEFDPHEAELAGAFVEDALTEVDAAESSVDLPTATN